MSLLEKRICQVLSKSNIDFIQEKCFKDLRNGLYRFDFYIPSQRAVIEVQGEQHYTYSKFFYKKRSEFTKAQERDRIKISYCLAHGLKMYCIPFWEVRGILTSQDIFQEKFLARSKFHNDEVWRLQKNRER